MSFEVVLKLVLGCLFFLFNTLCFVLFVVLSFVSDFFGFCVCEFVEMFVFSFLLVMILNIPVWFELHGLNHGNQLSIYFDNVLIFVSPPKARNLVGTC